ncbi:MAG: M20/M25/M40 family metallo-hydrolase [Rhodothermales bacterium]
MTATYRLRVASLITGLTLFVVPTYGQQMAEPVDEAVVEQIKKEGLENSHVMEYLSWMTDVYGPRLTGSPMLDKASDWAAGEMTSIGLTNVHKDDWGPFGKGWTLESFSIVAKTPDGGFPVVAYPKAWSAGTPGPVSGQVVRIEVESLEELEPYRGKLKDKIVFSQSIRELEEPFEPTARRLDDSDLLRLATAVPRTGGGNFRGGQGGAMQLQRQIANFILEERPLAVIDRGTKGDYGTIFVSSASIPSEQGASIRDVDAPASVPQFTMAVEHYNRIMRLLDKDIPVSIALDLKVSFKTDDPMEYNIIGEIAGTDPQIGEELVMLGAHYDSWHAGTGATDNASGSAVMMEAMRILKAVYDAKGQGPRRTIRIALWTGEEQGLLGSRAYVGEHFAESAGRGQPPSRLLPDHEKFSGYFNMDNGTGKIRGVYMQGNEAVAPIFRAWLAPFNDMGAATLTLNNTGGTDHLSFDAVGLPGFQFIQEPIAYSPKTHHSNMDVYDHTIADDLKQAATIIASFVYHTAQRDEKLPRKPMPAPPGP